MVQGMRGSGKTNYVKNKILDIIPVYIVDIRNEFKHIPAFTSLQNFSYFLLDKRNPNRWVKFPSRKDLYKEGQYRFIFNTRKELENLFRLFSHLRNCLIVVDESDALFSDRKLEIPLRDVFLGSRNNRVSMIFIGKRPFLIPILVRSQIDRFVIFKTQERRDIQYLEDRIDQRFPKDVSRLERGEAVVIEMGMEPELQVYEKFIGD